MSEVPLYESSAQVPARPALESLTSTAVRCTPLSHVRGSTFCSWGAPPTRSSGTPPSLREVLFPLFCEVLPSLFREVLPPLP